MKVRMRTTMAGPDGVVQAGRIAEVSRRKGEGLIKAGYAEELKVEPKAKPKKETTSAPPAGETTSTDEGAEGAPPADDGLDQMNREQLRQRAEQLKIKIPITTVTEKGIRQFIKKHLADKKAADDKTPAE